MTKTILHRNRCGLPRLTKTKTKRKIVARLTFVGQHFGVQAISKERDNKFFFSNHFLNQNCAGPFSLSFECLYPIHQNEVKKKKNPNCVHVIQFSLFFFFFSAIPPPPLLLTPPTLKEVVGNRTTFTLFFFPTQFEAPPSFVCRFFFLNFSLSSFVCDSFSFFRCFCFTFV